MTLRTDKVASLLHHEVGQYISGLELDALTTISKVEVSPDLKWCKIWVTIMGDGKLQERTLEQLELDLKEFQRQLNHKLSMKFVPKISFVLDHGEEYAANINELLRKTHEE